MSGPAVPLVAGYYTPTNRVLSKLPDQVVRGLVEEGFSGPQIVNILRHRHGIETTRSGLHKWRKRHGYKAVRALRPDEQLMPWRVLREHRLHWLYRALRTEAALRLSSTGPSDADLVRHRNVMAEIKALGAVVYYDRVNGFHLVHPRPWDTDIIMDPRRDRNNRAVNDESKWQ